MEYDGLCSMQAYEEGQEPLKTSYNHKVYTSAKALNQDLQQVYFLNWSKSNVFILIIYSKIHDLYY